MINKNMNGRHLTADIVAELDGRPIRLSSPYAEKKLLTISPMGKITLESPYTGFDQYWRLIPTDDGFLISSSKNGDMICHHTKDGGVITPKPLSEDTKDCVWKLGKKGEIYQPNPEGGERYLWLADDKLYATIDGYLAETWVPLTDVEQPPLPEQKSNVNSSIPIIIAVILVVIVLGVILMKNKNEK